MLTKLWYPDRDSNSNSRNRLPPSHSVYQFHHLGTLFNVGNEELDPPASSCKTGGQPTKLFAKNGSGRETRTPNRATNPATWFQIRPLVQPDARHESLGHFRGCPFPTSGVVPRHAPFKWYRFVGSNYASSFEHQIYSLARFLLRIKPAWRC